MICTFSQLGIAKWSWQGRTYTYTAGEFNKKWMEDMEVFGLTNNSAGLYSLLKLIAGVVFAFACLYILFKLNLYVYRLRDDHQSLARGHDFKKECQKIRELNAKK
jgi:hypothetical protein